MQIRRGLDLDMEPLCSHCGRQIRLEHRHRDLSPVPHVFGQANRGHAALAQLPLDSVAAREGHVQIRDRVVHGRKGTAVRAPSRLAAE